MFFLDAASFLTTFQHAVSLSLCHCCGNPKYKSLSKAHHHHQAQPQPDNPSLDKGRIGNSSSLSKGSKGNRFCLSKGTIHSRKIMETRSFFYFYHCNLLFTVRDIRNVIERFCCSIKRFFQFLCDFSFERFFLYIYGESFHVVQINYMECPSLGCGRVQVMSSLGCGQSRLCLFQVVRGLGCGSLGCGGLGCGSLGCGSLGCVLVPI